MRAHGRDHPHPSEVTNFPDDAKARIVPSGNKLRVITRKYYWDSDAGRGKEKRVYIGYIVENEYFSNDDYRRLFRADGQRRLVPKEAGEARIIRNFLPLRRLLAGEAPLYYAAAEETGLVADLEKTWGRERAAAVLALAFHQLSTGSSSVRLYESWSEGRLLPGTGEMDSADAAELLDSLSAQPGWKETFFGARMKRLGESDWYAFGADSFAAELTSVTYGQLGKHAGHQNRPGLIVLAGRRTGMPVMFRWSVGQDPDMPSVLNAICRCDHGADEARIFSAVLEGEYFSLKNIALAVDRKARVIMPAGMDADWIRGAVDQVYDRMNDNEHRLDNDSFGMTVECSPEFEDKVRRKVWVHVFRDDLKKSLEDRTFFEALRTFEAAWADRDTTEDERKCLQDGFLRKFFIPPYGSPGETPLRRNFPAINDATRYHGFYCNVSTMKCGADETVEIYKTLDLLEKCFRAERPDTGIATAWSPCEPASEGKFIVSFVALSVLTQIRNRMEEAARGSARSLGEVMTFNEIRNRLSTISICDHGDAGWKWEELTAAQRETVDRLGFGDLYRTLPDWGLPS